jgi:hypothetical protein
LPAGSGKQMTFTGTTVIKVRDGMIAEEIGLDDGVTVLQQLGLIPQQSGHLMTPRRERTGDQRPGRTRRPKL